MDLTNVLSTLIAQNPKIVEAILLFVVLGAINGVLPTRINGNIVTRVISVLVDRLAPLTRKDARNTLKLPLFSASVLRDVADAIDPPATPRPPTLPVLMMALTLTFAIAPMGCTPAPRPDGVYQPSGTLATIDSVARILGILTPALKPLVLVQIPADRVEDRRAVDIALTAFEGVTSSWLAGRRSWDLRSGAGYCAAYAATGAVTASFVDVIRTLGRVGVGMNPELAALVDALGILADRLAYCDPVFDAAVPAEADLDAQALLRATSHTSTLRALVDRVASEARDRGRPLTPLPPIAR